MVLWFSLPLCINENPSDVGVKDTQEVNCFIYDILALINFNHLPKSPVSFLKRPPPPCDRYFPNDSSKLGYVRYVPARSKNWGVAGTLWNLGTGLTSLNYLVIFSLSTSIAFFSPTVLWTDTFFPDASKKSNLSPLNTNVLVVLTFDLPVLVNRTS